MHFVHVACQVYLGRIALDATTGVQSLHASLAGLQSVRHCTAGWNAPIAPGSHSQICHKAQSQGTAVLSGAS